MVIAVAFGAAAAYFGIAVGVGFALDEHYPGDEWVVYFAAAWPLTIPAAAIGWCAYRLTRLVAR